jgi:hypothetical protein
MITRKKASLSSKSFRMRGTTLKIFRLIGMMRRGNRVEATPLFSSAYTGGPKKREYACAE